MGPVRQQADSVMNMIRSRRTAVHLVTVLEEMPVQETVDGVTELTNVDLPVGGVIVNMVRDPILEVDAIDAAAKGVLDVEEVSRGLKTAGVDVPPDVVSGLASEASEHARRVDLEHREREILLGLGRPTYELPLQPETVDLSGLYEMADRLAAQGMV